MTINSEYTHILHVLDSIEKKVDNLTLNVGSIKNTFKDINDVSKKLQVDVDKIAVASDDFTKARAELKVYFSFIKKEYFSNLKIDLDTKIESSSDDVITTLSETINNNHSDLESQIRDNNKIIIKTNEDLKLTNQRLEETKKELLNNNKELKEKLNFVKQEVEIQKNERLKKEERSNKIKNTKIQPKRDYIEYCEFNYLLESLDNNNLFENRKKCAFILLYITGLRVSNLLKFKIKHIKQLIFNKYTRIDLIKKGEIEHLITLSDKSHKLINNHYENFHSLFKYKDDDDFFFTSFSNPNKTINRCNFNTELNGVLKIISEKFNKNIKTHSFRTSYITDLLEIAPLHVVKDIIGHKVVASTEIYYRSSLTHKKSLNILNEADNYRFKE